MSAQQQHRYESFWDERLTPQQNKAVEMQRNGLSFQEIAEEMDLSTQHLSTCLNRARKRGVFVPYMHGHRCDKNGWSSLDLLALHQRGLSLEQIRERTGAQNVAVRLSQAKKRLGLPLMKMVPRADHAPRWLAEHQAGKTYREVAAGAGVSKNAVAGAIQRYRRKLAQSQITQGASR